MSEEEKLTPRQAKFVARLLGQFTKVCLYSRLYRNYDISKTNLERGDMRGRPPSRSHSMVNRRKL